MPFLGSAKDAKDLQNTMKDAKDLKDTMDAVGVSPDDMKRGLTAGKQAFDATGLTADDVKQGAAMAKQGGEIAVKGAVAGAGAALKGGKKINALAQKHLDFDGDGQITQEDFDRMAEDIKKQKTNRKDDLVIPLYLALLFCLVQIVSYGIKLKFTWMGITIGMFFLWFFAWKGILPDEYTLYLAGAFFIYDGVAVVFDILYINFLFLIYDSCEMLIHGWIFYTIHGNAVKRGEGDHDPRDLLVEKPAWIYDPKRGYPNERTPLGP